MEPSVAIESNIVDNFKDRFKYYKSNASKPSLDNVLKYDNFNCKDSKLGIRDDERIQFLGLRDLKNWKVCKVDKHPGLIIIPNPFTSWGQRYWIQQCLEVYPRAPNKKNIDIEVLLHDWWRSCHEGDSCNKQLRKKLRWTTLGFHHNWDTKVYQEDCQSPFPGDLAELCDVIAQFLGYNCFKAEAAIVNYYHMDSTLSAHTDHSEINLEAPLFSFSFGQSAIFLIGGRNKSVTPTPIMLNSGDILVMSEEARLCYHAVPKIIPAPSDTWSGDSELPEVTPAIQSKIQFKYIKNIEEVVERIEKVKKSSDCSQFLDYVKESRINVNVRQVLPDHHPRNL